jgi:SAM-dependent methyltransferase
MTTPFTQPGAEMDPHASVRKLDIEPFLATLPTEYANRVRARLQELQHFRNLRILEPEAYVGKVVLDWEAGDGAFSIALLLLGSAAVVAIDSWAGTDGIPPAARIVPGFSFYQISIQEWERKYAQSNVQFDLVFSNTVTEHIADLASAFDCIHRLLRNDGLYFNNHDNYYSACGSHDHGFWYYGDKGAIRFQGVDCWNREEKCAASSAHRTEIANRLPWTWSPQNDKELTPECCQNCRYYKRSQPWAHLLCVEEFREVFNDRSFVTPPRFGSSLNKITPFMLRQMLNEAGFKILACHRSRSTNIPEAKLIEMGFSALDLTTQTILTLCAPV